VIGDRYLEKCNLADKLIIQELSAEDDCNYLKQFDSVLALSNFY